MGAVPGWVRGRWQAAIRDDRLGFSLTMMRELSSMVWILLVPWCLEEETEERGGVRGERRREERGEGRTQRREEVLEEREEERGEGRGGHRGERRC